MQKQIVYPKFISRLFAMTIDIVILSLICTPIMNFLSKYIFIYIFRDFLLSHSIDIINNDAIISAVKSPEFTSYVTTSQFLIYSCSVFVVNVIFMGIYFVMFWSKFGTTPGKLLMRIKIIDVDNYSKPSIYNSIKRFCGYVTILIGIWSIIFNKKGRATHDKMANTMVVNL